MTRRNAFRVSKLSLGLIAALAAAPVFAQSATSAGVGGVVIGNDGQPVTNAEVTIVHVESGTTSRVTTDASGRYSARGLRVGGPYEITITKAGAGTKTEDNVFLGLNAANTVNAQLTGDVTTLATVTAVGVAGGSEIFSATKMGTGTSLNNDAIEALPSASRNIQDYIRLDPRISQVSKADGSISAGGQNSRYNVIRIDGVSNSDPFGLEANNMPTERQPVSMDAIEEIQIDLANYDTTISGGTGAVINAVTKSGTNEFHGSAYYTVRDGDWVRDELRGIDFNGFDKEETYGFTFGGPIIKDRLFFFANYEQFKRERPGTSLSGTPYGDGDITDGDIQRVIAASNAFGFDPGSFNPPSISETDIEEYAVKLDWNINDNHRAALRYSKTEEVVPKLVGFGGSSVSLSSYWYDQNKTFESTVAELFSDWSDNFSTEFKVSQRDYASVASTYADLPTIIINNVGTGQDTINLGTERNRHVNVVDTKQTTFFGAGTWYVGDHTLKFGFDYEDNDIVNFYGRDLNGVWTFNSLEDYEAGRVLRYDLRAPRAGGSRSDIPAAYTFENLGLFVQDTWAVNYNLSLMFGVRVDIPDFGDSPIYNPRIEEIYGLDNTVTVDKKLWQPRFGFNYTFDSERPTQLRGGVGLFQGGNPNVWLAGPFQNTGLNFDTYALTGGNVPAFDPSVPPDVPTGGAATAPRITADIMEPGLALPSIWKANLAFDHELPWYGLVASAELLVTKNKNALWFDRIDIGNPTRYGQDGREMFWNAAGYNPANRDGNGITNGRRGASNRANRNPQVDQAIVIRNTDKGSARQLTLALSKPMVDQWAWTLGYTYTDATEFSPATSSQNSSNWNNTLVLNANDPVGYNSRYAIKDRFTAALTWQKAFFGDNMTTAGLFYEGRSGRPFSYIYYNDFNGDSAGTNDLFYVPAGPGDVQWVGGAAMEQAFFDWMAAEAPELQAYRGQVAPANAFRAGWTNSFDVRVSQEIPMFFEGHKAEIALDIMNVGNLINKDWGLIDDYGFFATRRVANYAGIDPATGKYVYNFSGSTDNSGIQETNGDGINTAVSRWSVMLSLKYKF
ncbi:MULTISPECIES: carboxypeptidase regulatory-like domain-containing protein [unclassified Luteimonas]|uniref:TonB-dependent receptor n=1 Tax=unclassified Luteimonas TaxID=2629088 RepID=UPI0018F0D836|nr:MULTISPECIES: carboxypeptidase regulatory-like domain-containing protein [unclassified Luteimonas]MBJ6978781.1 TonB-dependent receptor [Luteimonas sp. MC1895]MBJ6983681.1 TonB-dependent receptor [Luteimonas sp. MC1750]QQO06520.1 TonB-dependent receptor [Luteimonas sp. MC1750]